MQWRGVFGLVFLVADIVMIFAILYAVGVLPWELVIEKLAPYYHWVF